MLTMSKPQLKTSIYLDPEIIAIIAEREVGKGTRSEVIRACVERYAEICRRHRPGLSSQEWSFLQEALDEKWLATSPLPSYVPAAARDYHARHGRPGTLDDTAIVELLTKLDSMAYAELVAILDAAERRVSSLKRGAPDGIV